jgi:hypothetical protein
MADVGFHNAYIGRIDGPVDGYVERQRNLSLGPVALHKMIHVRGIISRIDLGEFLQIALSFSRTVA